MYKICITCKEEKTSSEYRKDSGRKDGLQPWCKVCARQYHKSAYTERYRSKVQERNSKRFHKARQWLDAYKAHHSCTKCGEKEAVCLEFHHTDPDTKDFTIATNKNRSMEAIKEEVDKCIVVCRNCHAKIHAGII
jgi:hypothetical protein